MSFQATHVTSPRSRPTSAPRSPASSHTLPASHALALADLVKRWNVTPILLLEGSKLTYDELSNPETRVPFDEMIRLMQRARALTGEAGLGYYLGLQTRVSAHGYLGFAAMTSATLGEALELATRFSPTRTTALTLRLRIAQGKASLLIEERTNFGEAQDAIIPALMVGLWQIGSALLGKSLSGTADFTFDEPPYFRRFAHLVPPVRFRRPVHALTFDAALLHEKIVLADPAAQKLAQKQCEDALIALGFDGNVTERVRSLLTAEEVDGSRRVRSLPEVARALSLSERTLKRRLSDEGATYSGLLEEERKDLAMLLLRNKARTVSEVAYALGYSDAANFTRAFRRWTGESPAAFRAKEGEAPRQSLRRPPRIRSKNKNMLMKSR